MQKFPVFLCHSITKVWRRRKARVIKKLYLCWNGFEIWSAWIHELVLFKRGDSFGKLPFYKSSTETKTFYISKKNQEPCRDKSFLYIRNKSWPQVKKFPYMPTSNLHTDWKVFLLADHKSENSLSRNNKSFPGTKVEKSCFCIMFCLSYTF